MNYPFNHNHLLIHQVQEMFQKTCSSLQAEHCDDYDFTSRPNCRLIVEFGYQTLCATFVPTIFFDSKYACTDSSSSAPKSSPAVWHQDFFAKEEWCLDRYADKRLVARRAAAVMQRLVSEHSDWPTAFVRNALRTTLLRRLDSARSTSTCVDTGVVVADVLADIAGSLETRCLHHYFLSEVNLFDSLSEPSLRLLRDFFTPLTNADKLADVFAWVRLYVPYYVP